MFEFNSTNKELANGTLSWLTHTPMKYDPSKTESVKVYLGGQLRRTSANQWKGRVMQTIKSPKPKMVAGDPVRSAESAYLGAMEALIKYLERKAKK